MARQDLEAEIERRDLAALALKKLSPRYARVVRARSEGASFIELAEEEGCGPDRVRQIYETALRDIRIAFRRSGVSWLARS
jgi:DNA-directed RNA polymerase sigma subunit (sigma70/sigma32)